MPHTTHKTPTDRIDPDHYERSPSTGPEEVATILGALAGADHTPTCDRCDRDAEPIVVLDGDTPTRISVRCSVHAKDFLEVSA